MNKKTRKQIRTIVAGMINSHPQVFNNPKLYKQECHNGNWKDKNGKVVKEVNRLFNPHKALEKKICKLYKELPDHLKKLPINNIVASLVPQIAEEYKT